MFVNLPPWYHERLSTVIKPTIKIIFSNNPKNLRLRDSSRYSKKSFHVL